MTKAKEASGAASGLSAETPVVLVGGGRLDAAQLKALGGAFPVAAADGGADAVADAGLAPALVAGDFDSISATENFAGSRIVPAPDQDRTDFSKALGLIDAPLVIGLGLLGRRLDHTLAATGTLARFGAGPGARPVVLLDRYDAVFFADGGVSLALEAGDRVSVWPLHGQRFTGSKGLAWPLDGLFLQPGGMTGTSNRVAGGDGRVEITPEDGGSGYLVILEARRVAAAIEAVAPAWAGPVRELLAA